MSHEHPLYLAAVRKHLAGDVTGAEVDYRALLAEQPTHAPGQHYLGFLLQQAGRLEEAEACLLQALQLDARHAEWHFNLGIVLARRQRTDAAIDAFCQALALDPAPYFYWTNLGAAFEANQEWLRAEQCYHKAAQLDPACPDAFYLLSALLLKLERYDDARHFNHRGILADPSKAAVPIMRAQAWHALGDPAAAIAVLQQWQRDQPDNVEAAHLLVAYQGEAAPEQCSETYVEHVFDAFADTFDSILTRLDYSGPRLVADYLGRVQSRFAHALDLGCGTGLVGQAIRPWTDELVGVDLSQRMLQHAAQRGIYQSLHHAELGAFLQADTAPHDLICCMDTFTYIGQIEPVLALIHARLQPGGLLLCSTERLDEAGAHYRLNTSGRYSHSPAWIAAILREHGFVIAEIADTVIRKEAGYPLPGQFIAARRPA